MSVGHEKIRLAIERQARDGDVTSLAINALWLLRTITAMTAPRESPANYKVVGPAYDSDKWADYTEGTRDFCMGYAEAYVEGDNSHGARRALVVCGDFVLWPEESYGEVLPAKTSEWEWK